MSINNVSLIEDLKEDDGIVRPHIHATVQRNPAQTIAIRDGDGNTAIFFAEHVPHLIEALAIVCEVCLHDIAESVDSYR